MECTVTYNEDKPIEEQVMPCINWCKPSFDKDLALYVETVLYFDLSAQWELNFISI